MEKKRNQKDTKVYNCATRGSNQQMNKILFSILFIFLQFHSGKCMKCAKKKLAHHSLHLCTFKTPIWLKIILKKYVEYLNVLGVV